MTTDTTYISECCGVSLTGGRCSSCLEGCVGEEVKEETTYGEDIDAFVKKHCLPFDSKLATIELNLIVLKAIRASIAEISSSL